MNPRNPDPLPNRDRDELQRLLKESLKQKRPRRLRLALGTLFLVAGILALVFWLLAPSGATPILAVVAFDDLAVMDSEATLHGRLEDAGEGHADLSGKPMVFVDNQGLLLPGQEVKEVFAKTGPTGDVTCTWRFSPGATVGNFVLRQIGDKLHPGMEDRGRIFMAPAAARLCLVQVDNALTDGKDHDWRTAKIQDIMPAAGVAESLRQIAKKNFEIVYLALAAERPTVYQKMRAWLANQVTEPTGLLPAGPVVGRFTLPLPEQRGRLYQNGATRLSRLFVIPKSTNGTTHVAVAGTIDAAQQFHAAGLQTYYLGAGEDLPADVQRVRGWDDIRRLLGD